MQVTYRFHSLANEIMKKLDGIICLCHSLIHQKLYETFTQQTSFLPKKKIISNALGWRLTSLFWLLRLWALRRGEHQDNCPY